MSFSRIRILALIFVTVTLTSCNPFGGKDELSTIAEDVLKHKEGIEMDFKPLEKQ